MRNLEQVHVESWGASTSIPEMIDALKGYVADRKTIAPVAPAADDRLECRFDGDYRVVRYFSGGPYGHPDSFGKWVTRVDVCFEKDDK